MKQKMIALTMMLAIAATGKAMSYEQARDEALFLTDKMAYELNMTDEQYDAAYRINLDYLMGVTNYDDVYGNYWEARNRALNTILLEWQWDAFRTAAYFFRPVAWRDGRWHFGVRVRYPHHERMLFSRSRPIHVPAHHHVSHHDQPRPHHHVVPSHTTPQHHDNSFGGSHHATTGKGQDRGRSVAPGGGQRRGGDSTKSGRSFGGRR